MNRRMIVPLLFGLIGAFFLVQLGFWQLRRLDEKAGIQAEIALRMEVAPVAVPAAPDPESDGYLPVTATGDFTGEALDVLVSRREIGAGYRVVGVFETGGRRLLVDRGFVVDEARGAGHASAAGVAVTGNLHWPDEIDSYTPTPDVATGVWFARDVPALAAALDTEPVLIVARSDTGGGIEPMPVGDAGIPNNHLGYAVQWFLLAVVWMGMTALTLWRIRRKAF
ncbi:MAG: SURF1 family protein [Gemmobacter sp.]